MLSIFLFGPPQLVLDQHPLSITRRKSRALIYYMAANTTPLTRDHLLTFFWPDHDRPAAQQILRTTLHGLRQILGPALLVEENTLALAPTVEVDVRRFEALLTSSTSPVDFQRLTEALDLYRGDFLADFSLPDTLTFEDWVAVERERYRRLAVRGLTILSELYEAQHNFRAALEALERALAFDPLQEDLQRACLRLHYLAGDRAGAIRRYEALRKLLDDEMGVPPMAETRALYDAIITDTLPIPTTQTLEVSGQRPVVPRGGYTLGGQRAAAGSQRSNALPFTGRAAELQKLRQLEASHKLVLIEGEPGIGKTRLIEEFIQAASEVGANRPLASMEQPLLILRSGAHELEHTLPYHPIIEALRGLLAQPEWPAVRAQLDLPALWLTETARLLPELTPTTPDPLPSRLQGVPFVTVADESRLWEGIYQFLTALASQHRIIIVLDDLHWADASTLALLGYLIRRAENTAAPISFLAATRPPAPRSPLTILLQTLLRENRLERLTLARLSPDEITSLAHHLSPTYAYPLANWLNQATEGNPYILAEVVRDARDAERGLLLPDGTLNLHLLSASPIVPQPVYTLIQSRLARLSEAARRVLDTAVAAGREFEFKIVARAAALSENAALDALDELLAAGLIYPQGSDGLHYTFDHSLTMEVAYREVGEARHRRLHHRVAEALESIYGRQQLDSVAGLVAYHFAENNAFERAAPYAFRAGQLAANLAAWTEAIIFYEQARQGFADRPDSDVQHWTTLMALAEARLHIGELAQATEALHVALTLAKARADLAGVLEAQLALADSLLLQGRYEEVMSLAEQVCDTSRIESRVNSELLQGRALFLEGADLDGAVAHYRQAEALLHEAGPQAQLNPAMLTQVRFELGNALAQQGDLPGAIILYRDTLATALAAPVSDTTVRWRIMTHNNLAYHLHLLGDPASLETALEHARAGLALAQERGMLGLLPYLLSTLGEIALAQDDLTAAENHFTEGLTIAERFSIPERIAGLTANLGLVAAQRGQTSLALHRLSTAFANADALGNRYLAAQIRLWLAPLLPATEAQVRLTEARIIAESSSYHRLLEEAARLETQLF